MAKKWMAGVVAKMKKGAFTAQARRAGKSVAAFRKSVLSNKDRYSATTVRRAVLARTFARARKRKAA